MKREIIAGRTSLKRSIREYLTKLLDEGRETRSFIPFKKIKEAPTLPPSIYLLHGEEGIGKTTSLNYCLAIAEEVAEEYKKDIHTLFIDLEEIRYVKASHSVSPLEVMNLIAEYFSTLKDGISQTFFSYNKTAENYLEVRERVNEYIIKGKVEESLQKININKGDYLKEKEDAEEVEVEITALNSNVSVEKKLGEILSKEELEIYQNGEKKLAELIVSAIASSAENSPLIVAFDNYDYLSPQTEEWFRKEILKKIIDKKKKIVFIIGGNHSILRKFRNDFPEEVLFTVNLSDITLTKSTISLLASKLHINLSQDDAEAIEKYSAGIPLIVNDILFYFSKGIPLNEIIEAKENEIKDLDTLSSAMVKRFFTKCNDDNVRLKLFSLAMLVQFNPKILSELWGISLAEVKNTISSLEDSLSFVKDGIIHPLIRKILYNSLIEEAAKGSQSSLRTFFVNFSTVCVKLCKEQLNHLDSVIPSATKRCKDEHYLSAVEQLICGTMWSSPTDAFVSLPAYYLELLHFNPDGVRRVLSRLEEFRYLFSPINEKIFKQLNAGFSLVDKERITNQISPESFEEELVSYIEPLTSSMNEFQRALFLHVKGSLELRKGNFKQALELLNNSFSIFGNVAQEKAILYADYAVLGTIFYNKNEYRYCIESFSNAVLIYADSFIPWYIMGISRMTVEEYEGAVNALSEAVKVAPSHADAWYNLGLSYAKINQFTEAVNSFLKATQITPNRTEVWFELGKAYVVLKQHNEAVNALRKVVELDKENAEAWLLLGQSCSILGLSEEAIDSYNKSLEIKPKSIEALKSLGNEYLKLNKFEDAVSTFTKATRISKKDPELWCLISEAHYGASQYDKAIEASEKAIEIDSNNIRGWQNLGNVYMKIEEFDKAIEAFKKCVEIEEDNAEVWLKLGTIYNNKKEYELGIAALKKAVAYNPNLKDVWYTIGLAYEAQNKFAEAIASYDRGTQADPQNYECWYHKGNMYVKLDQYEDAFDCYSQVVKINPSLIDSWFKRGIAATKIENFKEAINSFAKVVEIDPSNTEGWYQLGLAYKKIGDHQEAIRSFTEAVTQNDKRSEIWMELGDSCMSIGIYEEAITAYQKCTEIEPSNVLLYRKLGDCYAALNNYEKASQSYSKAVELAPEEIDTIYKLATIHHANGNLSEAIKYYSIVTSKKDDHAEALLNLAIAYHSTGEYQKAIEIYLITTKKWPKNATAWFNLGIAYHAIQDYDNAILSYREAAKLQPKDPEIWYHLGLALHSKEQYGDAIQAYRKVLQFNPNHIDAWFNLGVSYYVWQNYIDAIDAYKNVVQKDPSNFTAWGNLALSYFYHEDYKNGLEAALKAYNLKPDEPWLVANLITGYLFTGNSSKAIEFTDALLSISDNKDAILNTISLIENIGTKHPQVEGIDTVLSKLKSIAIPMVE